MASNLRLEFDDVSKTFRRGAYSRTLREAIPAMWREVRGSAQPTATPADEFYSLKDVSFDVKAGECVGVIGHNGAGKSTLLKCASRILRPNKGEVRVKGRLSALIEVGAGFHPDLTGRENVFLNGTILGMRRREIANRFDEIVEFAGMEKFIDTPVKRYSSGMYARLGFSVAAFMDPDVLLIDEVLSVGDVNFSRKCERKIAEIVAGDTTVLFVSHNLAAVRMICDRVLLLRGGKVEFDGPTLAGVHKYHELLSEEGNGGQADPCIAGMKLTMGDDDAVVSTVETGGSVALDAEVRAAESIRELTVGFQVLDEAGQLLYEIRSEEVGADPADLQPGGVFRTRFKLAANLLPGVYWIGVSIRGRSKRSVQSEPDCLAYLPNRLQLDVRGPGEGRGSVNLFAQCVGDVEQNSTATALSPRTAVRGLAMR
jgi:lipopolysaccharide transport system ATP-binding protein